MRLLFVVPEYPPHVGGGIATYYGDLLARCVARGHEVDVLLGSPHAVGDHPVTTVAGVRVDRVRPELYARYRARLRRFDVYPDLRALRGGGGAAGEPAGRGRAYDLVECTDWGLTFVPWIAEDSELPVRVRLHGSSGQIEEHDPQLGGTSQAALFRLIEASLLPHADALATYSHANRRFWEDLLGVPVHWHYPGLPLPAPSAAAEPPSGTAEGLVVGRVQAWKGPLVLCEAMRRLGAERPRISWVGRGMPYRGHRLGMLAFLREHYGDVWGRDVQHTDALPPSDVRALQSRAAFGVVPSTWDVFNLTCVEFMALGRPVVCSEGAGAASLIVDGENGFRCAADDPASLADALARLRGCGPRLREIGLRARETALAEVGVEAAADDLLADGEALVRAGRRAARPARWLREFVEPLEGGDDHRAMLDQLTLRSIVSYNLHRGLRKVLPGLVLSLMGNAG